MTKRKHSKKKSKKIIRIFPDSSILISYLNKNDVHHQHACSCFGMLIPHHPTFYFSTVVVMETMSGLIRNGFTTKKSYDLVIKFITKLEDYRSERPIGLISVLKKYQAFAKTKKIKTLTTIDFYIVTEAMSIGAKILTTDKKMYKITQKSYKEIYLITDKVKGISSDLPNLTRDIIYNLN